MSLWVILLFIPHVVLFETVMITSKDIIEFCISNGLKQVEILYENSTDLYSKKFARDLYRESKIRSHIRSSMKKFIEYERSTSKFRLSIKEERDSLIVLSYSYENDWDNIMEAICKWKGKSNLFVILYPISKSSLKKLIQVTSDFSNNCQFDLVYSTGSNVVWKRVIKIKDNSESIFTSLSFDNFGKIITNYNLEGAHLRCSALSWQPYLSLSECNGDGSNCNSHGYLADLMNILGDMYNFTWHCDSEPNSNWGMLPESGPHTINGTWKGVFGNVINGNYSISLSFYTISSARADLCDYIRMGPGVDYLLAFVPQHPTYDSSLFSRPFRNEIWFVIGILFLVFIFVLFLTSQPKKCQNNDLLSYRMTVSIAWFSSFLVTVYYEGALTMFFATEISSPFRNLEESVFAYPEWKLMIRKSEAGLWYAYATQGEKEKYIQEYWGRIQSSPGETIYDSLPHGLSLIENDRVATKNSPLTPILRHGSQILQENGILAALDAKWVGKNVESDNSRTTEVFVLETNQLMLSFVILSGAMIVSLVALIFERINVFIK